MRPAETRWRHGCDLGKAFALKKRRHTGVTQQKPAVLGGETVINDEGKLMEKGKTSEDQHKKKDVTEEVNERRDISSGGTFHRRWRNVPAAGTFLKEDLTHERAKCTMSSECIRLSCINQNKWMVWLG